LFMSLCGFAALKQAEQRSTTFAFSITVSMRYRGARTLFCSANRLDQSDWLDVLPRDTG
jgi:hypothetical protein